MFEREWSGFFPSGTGRPALPARLVAGMMYLQHANKMSDEVAVREWTENAYWQYFCGMEHWQRRAPMDATSLVRWRQRIGGAGAELLLRETVSAAKRCSLVKKTNFKWVAVDTTVMEKAVSFPTDSGLLESGRLAPVRAAEEAGLRLRQNYNRVCPMLSLKAGRYARARQHRRMRRELGKQRTRVGRVHRDVARQLGNVTDDTFRGRLEGLLSAVEKILGQERHSKGKLYSLHAPEVECICKGKAHKKYEFGVKVSVATDIKSNLVVGMMSCPGNPYDGHTLPHALDQVKDMCGRMTAEVHVDRGYRNHGIDPEGVTVCISGQGKRLRKASRKRQRFRNVVGVAIGHMKADGRLGRNTLAERIGDALFAQLYGSGHNIRLLLSQIASFLRPAPGRLYLAFFFAFLKRVFGFLASKTSPEAALI